jgi:heme exporter protein B
VAGVIGPRVAGAVLGKDLMLDLRSRDRLGHMLVFAALVVVLLSISLPAPDARTRAWIPTLLWVVFLFTSLLGLGRSIEAEREEGGLGLLVQAPCDRGWVFVGKATASALALLVVELWTGLLAVIFLDVDWSGRLGPALGLAGLGAAGLACVGTLFSTMSASARFRELLLPLMLFPLALPLLVYASRATGELLAGRDIPPSWWGFLLLYDWTFALIGYFVFDYVLEE